LVSLVFRRAWRDHPAKIGKPRIGDMRTDGVNHLGPQAIA
jgi:hypothetical protein